jgi:hypothetical protein
MADRLATNLHHLVKKAYPEPEWAVFFEVSNGTGAGAQRHADAIALGIWPSRGFRLIGFEFKTYRGDWLRERKNPEKAEAIVSLVDSFYVVTSGAGVAALEEVPATWGLLEADASRQKLIRRREAPLLPDRDQTTMRRSFVAAILRKVPQTTVPKATYQADLEAGIAAARERDRDGYEVRQLQAQVDRLEGYLARFQTATGVDLRNGWEGPEKIGEAVTAVLNLRRTLRHLDEHLTGVERHCRSISDAVATLRSTCETDAAPAPAGAGLTKG